MKAFKRIVAMALCLVMALSVMGMVAFAETVDTIDTTKTGSITIHKYEYNGNVKNEGTGSATDSVPSGANKLAGAGFTIYKVADIDALTNYYSTNPAALPDVSTYLAADGKTIADAYADKVVTYTDSEGTEKSEKITGADGVVTFAGLALGLYVVIETTPPDSVTDPCEPFILSVPMTTVDGDNWLYDIHVYPKNGTSYGEIELVKKGENDALLEGVTFVLQKKNADNTTWTTITKQAGAQGDNTGDALTLTTDEDGKITVAGLSNGTYRFIETDLGTNKNAGYILNGVAAYEFTVNSGKITYNGTESENATITVTNEKPDAEKEVKDRTNGTWGNASDYSVGDTIEYKITVSVPSTIAELRTFTVTDTPTNLKDDANSVKVYKADGETEITGITATATANGGFTIAFNSYADGVVTSALTSEAGKEIIIKYKAVLQEDAVVTSTGNPNTVELKYSNAIYPDSDPTNPNNDKEPKEDKITDQAIVYTFELDVKKTDADGKALEGVEFDLYLYNGTETVTEALLKEKGTKINTTSLVTDANGKIVVSGLENGNYYLVETKTNEGYNLLKSPVKVEINVVYATQTTATTTYNENGDVIATKVTTKTFTESNGTANDGIFGTSIINKKGFELPTTGGIGTLMFIVIGAVLIGGGVCLLAPSKKRAR